MAVTKQDVAKLYVALFGRAPEGEGLDYWFLKSFENNWGLKETAQAMYEAAIQYPEYSNYSDPQVLVEAIYQNVLGKSSTDDPEGVNYWVQQIQQGNVTAGKVAATIIYVAETQYPDHPATKTLENRTEVALYVAEKFPQFDGNFEKFKSFISVVNDDPNSINVAKEIVDTYAPKPLTLTKSSVSGSYDMLEGGDGDDVFNALALNSLEDGDVLDGKAGKDVLNAKFDTGTTSALTITPTVQNIETINLSHAKGNQNLTYDFTATTGVEEVYVTDENSSNAITITLQNLSKAVKVGVKGGVTTNTDNLTVAFNDVSGTEDEANLIIENNGQIGTVTIGGVETINIEAKGDANSNNKIAALTAAAATTLNVSGDGKIEISDISGSTNLKSVNASTNKGGVILGSVANPINDAITTVKGGSGDDKLYFASGNIASTDDIDAGDGTDIAVLQGGTNNNLSALKNFEAVQIADNFDDGAATNITYDLSKFTNSTLQTVIISEGSYDDSDTNNDTLTIQNIDGQDVKIIDAALTNSGTGNFTLNLSAKNADSSLNLYIDNGTQANGADVEKLTTTNIKTLNLTVEDPKSKLGNGQVINLSSVSGMETINLTAKASTKVVVGNSVKTVDASTSTADVEIDGTSGYTNTETGLQSAMTIKTGSGNDTVKGTGENDTIETGTGNDTIDVGTDGNDTVNAGAGDDIIKVSHDKLTSDDPIDGGEGTDTLLFTGISNGTNVNLSGTNSANLSHVSNVEKIGLDLTGLNNNESAKLTIDDASLAVANNNLSIVANNSQDGNNNETITYEINASSVVLNLGKINVDISSDDLKGGDDGDTVKLEYTGGNAQETVVGGAGSDTFIYSTTAYLSSTDQIDGGAGTDVIVFSESTGDVTITADQLSGLKNIDEINLDGVDGANGNKKSITITDAVALNMVGQGNTLKIYSKNASGNVDDNTTNGSLTIDASAVQSVKLDIAGALGADTIKGGANDDTITLNDDDKLDTVTLGAGKDTIDLTNLTLTETQTEVKITDFDFGTNSTTVDTLKLKAETKGTLTGDEFSDSTDIKLQSGVPFDVSANYIIILDQAAYSSAADAEDAVQALDNDGNNTDNNVAYVFWQDTLGNVHLSYDNDIDTDGNGFEADLAVFTGIDITDIANKLNISAANSDIIFD